MKILVTGAGGFVGRHLTAHLRAGGHRIVPLARGEASGDPDAFVGPADLADLDGAGPWPDGIEAVVHLAALNPTRQDRASSDLDALRHANVEATAALARRAAREGVARMIFVGSAAVHAPQGPAPVSEDAPLSPRTPYATSKAQAETAFRRALAGLPMTGCVLRPAPVFGFGTRNLTGALARLARSPFPLPLEGLGGPRSLVCVDGLAGAIRLCLLLDAAAGKTFLVSDDGPLTPAQIVSALREGRGRHPSILPAPVLAARLAARLCGRREAFEAATRGFVIDNRLIRDTLGWRPADTRDALCRMAADGRL